MSLILIADDDPAGRDVYALILRRAGYSVVTVADGEEALRAMRKRRVDLLLLDLAMPEASGPTVLLTMQKDPLLSRIPVLVMTALPEQVARDRVRSFSVAGLLVKSRFSKQDLVG